MQIQSTALTTLIGTIVMFGAAFIIERRVRQAAGTVLRSVKLFQYFFSWFGIFFLVMWLPVNLLTIRPADFPAAMAWGYVAGHVFLYAAFICAALMLCAMVPRLAGKERMVLTVGVALATAQTIVNAATMIWGQQPSYNYAQMVVQYNAAPVVGAGIGLMALLTILPAGILFIMNAVRNPAQRLRSGLMGIGFLLMTVAGPMHDVATSWQMYAVADVFTTVSILLVGAGLLYRLDQSLVPVKPAAPRATSTTSPTPTAGQPG